MSTVDPLIATTVAATPTAPSSAAAPNRTAARIRYHLLMLLGALGVLTLAAVMQLDTAGQVALPCIGTLPAMCVWRQMFGRDCPGCGLTRSFVALAHGQFWRAWQFNAAGPLVFAWFVYQVPLHGVQVWRIRAGRAEFRHRPLTMILAAWIVAAVLMAHWAWRMR